MGLRAVEDAPEHPAATFPSPDLGLLLFMSTWPCGLLALSLSQIRILPLSYLCPNAPNRTTYSELYNILQWTQQDSRERGLLFASDDLS